MNPRNIPFLPVGEIYDIIEKQKRNMLAFEEKKSIPSSVYSSYNSKVKALTNAYEEKEYEKLISAILIHGIDPDIRLESIAREYFLIVKAALDLNLSW